MNIVYSIVLTELIYIYIYIISNRRIAYIYIYIRIGEYNKCRRGTVAK